MLKSQDVVMEKLKDNMPFQPFMDLRNISLSGFFESFPKEAVERSSRVFHDEAIHKAISLEKPPKKSVNKLQSQFLKYPNPQSS